MNTILTEVESIINARPLTYVYDDTESISYPLTPSHLISGRRITNTPNSTHYEVVSTNNSLTRRSKHHCALLRHFTNDWRRNYLLNLRENNTKSYGSNKLKQTESRCLQFNRLMNEKCFLQNNPTTIQDLDGKRRWPESYNEDTLIIS